MDFEAELAKFQPSLDIEQAEDAIYGNKTTDVTDLIQSILSHKATNTVAGATPAASQTPDAADNADGAVPIEWVGEP